MLRDPYNALLEVGWMVAFASPFLLFLCDVVPFAVVVVCIPIRIDRP
jgi:hypothetical protein